MDFSGPTLVCSLVLLLCVADAAWVNCPSQEYCEFEIMLKAQTSWSGISNTTFLNDLGSSTGVDNVLFKNMSKIFDTIVIGVLAVYDTQNASSIAWDIVSEINTNVTIAVRDFNLRYNVLHASYGYIPVIVPSYLRIPDEPDQMIFAVLGGIAAFLVVLQFGYGYWHFKGFGFITVVQGERD
jgi:hypothetical protein